MKIEHKIFEAEVKAFDDENLILEHFISTEHKDRGGDIMRAKGMKIVGKPVVLMLHGRGPMGSEPIAKPLSITVDEFKGQPGVLAKTQYFPDDTGRRLYLKSKGGYMPNWSIGYAVDEAKDIMEAGRFAGRDVTKWQLLEYSPVGVPMNPFAQTVKEFLDDVDAKADMNEKWFAPRHDEIVQATNGAWFGVVDEKSCSGCGACEGKHGECSTCKGPMTHFMKEGKYAGSACEKCDPEKYAEMTKAIVTSEEDGIELPPDRKTKEKCASCGGDLWQKFGWIKENEVFAAVKMYCKEKGCEKVIFIPDNTKRLISHMNRIYALEEKFAALETMVTLNAKALQEMKDAWDGLSIDISKLEPLLKTLPPEPEGGKEGEEEHHDNPPEKKTPPRLVVVRDEDTPEGKQQAQRAQILAAAREAIGTVVSQEIDRMKGRVP